jgi:DNA-binding protein Fis
MKSKDRRLIEKHPHVARKYGRKAGYYYNQKDWSTLKLLEHLDFQNVEAYFIKVNSKALKDKLYEIVLKDFESVILHSKSEYMLKRLREEGVFVEGVRRSLIDSYINQKY